MSKTSSTKKPKTVKPAEVKELEQQIQKMSIEELKELLLINAYKLAMTRSELEAITEILIKKKILTYEEVWRRTNEIFKDNS